MTVKEVKDGDAIFNDLASMEGSRHSFTPSVMLKGNNISRRSRRHRSRSVETTQASNTTSFGPYVELQSTSGSSFGTSNTASMDGNHKKEKITVDNISALGDETENDEYDPVFFAGEQPARAASEKLPPLPPMRSNPLVGGIFTRSRSSSSSPEVDLYSKISSLQTELNQYSDLQKTYENLEKEFLKVKMESAENRTKNDVYENEMRSLQHDIENLKMVNDEKDKRIERLEQENIHMRNKLHSLEEWRIRRIEDMTQEMELLMSLGVTVNKAPYRRKSKRNIFSDVKKITGFGGVEEDDDDDDSTNTHYLNALNAVLARSQKDSESTTSSKSQKRRSLQGRKIMMPNRLVTNESFSEKERKSKDQQVYEDERHNTNSFDNRSKESDSQKSALSKLRGLVSNSLEVEHLKNGRKIKKERINTPDSSKQIENEKEVSVDASLNHKFYVSDVSNEGQSLPSKFTSNSDNNQSPESEETRDQYNTNVNTLHITSDEEADSLPSKISLQSAPGSRKTEADNTTEKTTIMRQNMIEQLDREETATHVYQPERYTREKTATNVFQFPNPYKEEDSATALDHEMQSKNDDSFVDFDSDWGERQLEKRRHQKETEEQELEEQKLLAHENSSSFGFGMFRRSTLNHGIEVNRYRHPPPRSILGQKKSRLIDLPLSLPGRGENSSNNSILLNSPRSSGKRASIW